MNYLRGLRAQILLRTLLPLIVVLVAVSFGSITLHQRSMRAMVAERDAHLAEHAASWFDEAISTRALLLQLIVRTAAASPNTSQALENLAPAGQRFDQGFGLYDPQGLPLYESTPTMRGHASETRLLLDEAGRKPGSAAFRLVPRAAGPPLLLIAWADSQSQLTGVGAVSDTGLNVNRLLLLSPRIPQAVAYLLDVNGRVIYHRDPSQIGKDRLEHKGVVEALRGAAGTAFEDLPDEEEHVVGYAPVPSTGWALLVEEPWGEVIAPAMQYTLWAPVVVLLAAVVSLISLSFGVRRVVQPLQALRRAASRLAWGDFDAIQTPAGGIHEIVDLQLTLQEMAAQVHRYQSGMQDYVAALTQAQEEERRRLARELHDETIQGLIALSQRVKMLELEFQANSGNVDALLRQNVVTRLEELAALINQSLKELRSLIHDLRPLYLDELGLVSALKMLATNLAQRSVRATFDVVGLERRMSPDAELGAYRVAQACISNALRHGQAATISTTLEFDDKGLLLTVDDDGVGFTPPDRPSDLALDGHFGLLGMYERVQRLGGHLSIRSAPGEGTTIVAFLPYDPPSARISDFLRPEAPVDSAESRLARVDRIA